MLDSELLSVDIVDKCLVQVFLKRVYAIFDQSPGAPKIGFVQRNR